MTTPFEATLAAFNNVVTRVVAALARHDFAERRARDRRAAIEGAGAIIAALNRFRDAGQPLGDLTPEDMLSRLERYQTPARRH